jgi:putative flippase GtrA
MRFTRSANETLSTCCAAQPAWLCLLVAVLYCSRHPNPNHRLPNIPANQETGSLHPMTFPREFPVFVVVGGVATGAHYLLLVILVQAFRVEPTIASTAGFILGASVSYILNYRITFRSRRAHTSAVPRFAVAATTGVLLNGLFVALGVHVLALHYMVAQVMSTAMVLTWNFLANKYWTFSGGPA